MGTTTFGVLLIAAGVLLLADRLGYLDFGHVVSTWWPSLIVLAGLHHLRHARTRNFGLLLVAAGALWQLSRLHLLPAGLTRAVWPLLLILLGLMLVLQGSRGRAGRPDTRSSLETIALFGSQYHAVKSQEFQGAQVTAVFGDAHLDLREARLNPDGAQLDLVAVFGDIQVTVPPSWRIDLKTTAMFGDVRDERLPAGSPAARDPDSGHGPGPVLTVGGAAVFGDVKIRS